MLFLRSPLTVLDTEPAIALNKLPFKEDLLQTSAGMTKNPSEEGYGHQETNPIPSMGLGLPMPSLVHFCQLKLMKEL